MSISRTIIFIIKVFIAIALISILIGVASADLAPDVSLVSVLIVCVIAVAIFLIVLIFGIIGGASFNQSIIRRGGIDTAWLWFNSEPPGLEKLRAELKESKK
jgi:hypothetical protein